jgi:NTE family protein
VSSTQTLRPTCIGLALSGGAVRGAAHVGVLQVLERYGITPWVVAGTSVGALVGAAYAAGVPAAEASRIFRAMSWPKLVRPSLGSRYSLLDTRRMVQVLAPALGVETFEELPHPFAAVACDLLTGRRVVYRSGPLMPALRASSAVPGLFAPVEHGDQLLVDGCVVDNLPVDVARDLGADYVIAVDLVPPPSGRRRPRNVLEVLTLAGYLWSRANHPHPSTIECLITPDIGDSAAWSFSSVADLEAAGREAAEAALPKLTRDLGLG